MPIILIKKIYQETKTFLNQEIKVAG